MSYFQTAATVAESYDRSGASGTGAMNMVVLDNIFIFISGALVFLMQAGFALVEAGLTRAKNAANIMMKNLMDVSIGVLMFALIGWGIAYPGDFNFLGGLLGSAGLGIQASSPPIWLTSALRQWLVTASIHWPYRSTSSSKPPSPQRQQPLSLELLLGEPSSLATWPTR